MSNSINRVGLSWLYDFIKFDLINVYNFLKKDVSKEKNSISNSTASVALKNADKKIAHLAKTFYLLNIPAGVFFTNEFRLSIKYIENNYANNIEEQIAKEKIAIIYNNIENILNYVDDVIQGYGDLLIYYVSVIDELRLVREAPFFSQSTYIINSVKQNNISDFNANFETQQANIISRNLALITQDFSNKDFDNKLNHINAIKNEFKKTQHYLLWELIYAFCLLERNYPIKSGIILNNLLSQIIKSYNELFNTMEFNKIFKFIPGWIGTLCFNLLYCSGFQMLDKTTRNKILKILVIHDKKSLTNYLAFASRMQDTDGWILILDIASELDFAINRLQEAKRKKRVDISWLLEIMQKHIDSCILTGTYQPLEHYYYTVQKIHQYTAAGGFISGDDLEAIEALTLDLIKNIEMSIADNDFKRNDELQHLLENQSTIEVNQEAQKTLLKQQASDLESIINLIQTEVSLQKQTVEDLLHKIINIFSLVNFEPGLNIITNYLNKFRLHNSINHSLKQNLLVFIKYLLEIVKALYNGQDYVFHLKSAKKLIDAIEVAAIQLAENFIEDPIANPVEFTPDVIVDTVEINQKKSSLTQVFFDEAHDIIENINITFVNWSNDFNNATLSLGINRDYINSLLRELHTLKGAARMVGFAVLGDWAHHLEGLLQELLQWCDTDFDQLSEKNIQVFKHGINVIWNLMVVYQADRVPEMPSYMTLDFTKDLSKDLNKSPVVQAKESKLQYKIPLRNSIRINKSKIDELFEMVYSLKRDYNQLSECIVTHNLECDQHDHHALVQLAQKNSENISKIFEQITTLRMVPLSAIKSRLESLAQGIASELGKKIKLHIKKLDGEIDGLLLEKITPCLEHLIRNSIDHGIEQEGERKKYNKSIEGNIYLNIYSSQELLNIELADDGAGVDIQKLENRVKRKLTTNVDILKAIIGPGVSTADHITNISGRGIGLDVVNTIIKEMHGTFELETNRHIGTKFIIRLPDDLKNVTEIIEHKLQSSSQQKLNILALEDSATIRQTMEEFLSADKYNLMLAVDGLDGLEKIKSFTPDLILLDVSMPNMNGLEFLKIIRQEDKFKYTPTIVTTSREEQVFRNLAMQLNVDVYLKKPYDIATLNNAIDYVVA